MNSLQLKTIEFIKSNLADKALLLEWLIESIRADQRYTAHLADLRLQVEEKIAEVIKQGSPILQEEEPVPMTELHAEYIRALGYLTALHPTMEIDPDHPMKMAEKILHFVSDERNKFVDLLERAWGIIANSSNGDWEKESPEWRQAVNEWRDDYHVLVWPEVRKERMAKALDIEPNGLNDEPTVKPEMFHGMPVTSQDNQTQEPPEKELGTTVGKS